MQTTNLWLNRTLYTPKHHRTTTIYVSTPKTFEARGLTLLTEYPDNSPSDLPVSTELSGPIKINSQLHLVLRPDLEYPSKSLIERATWYYTGTIIYHNIERPYI